MIRQCERSDFRQIYEVINNAARVYQSIIPAEHWETPYMSEDHLLREISSGIIFWGFQDGQRLAGVMGIQPLQEVTLIRHAYVAAERQRQGIGGRLLTHLYGLAAGPVLIGTWAGADWAIRFYQKHGFCLVPKEETGSLLSKYWTAPGWHRDRSVVLADRKWFNLASQARNSGSSS